MAASAYRAEEKLKDEQKNRSFNYSKKDFCLSKTILLPKNAPKEYSIRSTLWNAVEKSEKRNDAQLSREFQLALPKEINLEEQVKLAENFCKKQLVNRGMICDIAIHNQRDGNGNFHAHVMTTTRTVNPNGFGLKNRDWNNKALIFEWRESWANEVNLSLKRNYSNETVCSDRLLAPLTKTNKDNTFYRNKRLENGTNEGRIKRLKRLGKGFNKGRANSRNEERSRHLPSVFSNGIRSAKKDDGAAPKFKDRLIEDTTERIRKHAIEVRMHFARLTRERKKKLKAEKALVKLYSDLERTFDSSVPSVPDRTKRKDPVSRGRGR